LFAAELLLPAPVLYRLVVEQGWNSDRIIAHSGLSETCVFAQLTNALLLPQPNVENQATGSNLATEVHDDRPNIGSSLDPSQRAAATIERGPVLVDAGPGTGKTRTLVGRILHLIQDRDVRPDNILALTFSRKAAEEMQTRLREEIGEPADQ